VVKPGPPLLHVDNPFGLVEIIAPGYTDFMGRIWAVHGVFPASVFALLPPSGVLPLGSALVDGTQ
jgi:hypothetical protein